MTLTPLAQALQDAGLRSPALRWRAIWMPAFAYRFIKYGYEQPRSARQ